MTKAGQDLGWGGQMMSQRLGVTWTAILTEYAGSPKSVRDLDERVRAAAFEFLRVQTAIHEKYLPLALLQEGFLFEGERIRLMFAGRGIFKPRMLPDLPLSLTTTPETTRKPRPYEDEFGRDGLLHYRYQGTDPSGRDNVLVRRAMERHVPLIYFHGHVASKYHAFWPAYVVGDDPKALTFFVEFDFGDLAPSGTFGQAEDDSDRRRYATRIVQQRLHQGEFRDRVIEAYSERCAVCRLGHPELLEAAHILRDRHPIGRPVVSNGLALCGLHHSAFDASLLGIRPDLKIEIREDVLREKDGPLLVHGLQGFQGARIAVPRRAELQPNRDFLAERYDMFRKAGQVR